jgi:hypothetical protein
VKSAARPSIFEPALRELDASGRAWSEPVSFLEYCRHHGLRPSTTAAAISVQALEGLDRRLIEAGVMVFRLGRASDSRSTRFALVRAPRQLAEFFFVDRELFSGPLLPYPLEVSPELLVPFRILGTAMETAAVNLAIASGLLATALGLDAPAPRIAPTTWASTASFEVRPHELHDVRWQHLDGQVEVDALLFGRVRGKPTLFVVEAKHGRGASLAKHKLAYACAVVAQSPLARGMRLVPVYLRSESPHPGVLHYRIAQCQPLDLPGELPPVASLRVVHTAGYALPIDTP